MWRREKLLALLEGMQIGATAVESSIELPKILKIEMPYDLAIPFLGIYPKKPETLIQMNICIPMFIAALFTLAKIWKQAKYPSIWVD